MPTLSFRKFSYIGVGFLSLFVFLFAMYVTKAPLYVAAKILPVCSSSSSNVDGSVSRTCSCTGREMELYDNTADNGDRKTICLGKIDNYSCHTWSRERGFEIADCR